MRRDLINNNSTKIVLGHPLSGALYAYFDKELNDGHHIKNSQNHVYYKTLYGKHYESYIDISLTLSLVYDNVILIAADNPVPDYDKYQDEGEYYNPDFGLFFTANTAIFSVTEDHEEIKLALADKEIIKLLIGIPKHAHSQIIRDVFFEVEMANEFDATLFTLGRRQALAKRIIEIAYKPNPEFSDPKIKIVSSYIDITGLLFQPMEIQSFYYLKTEKDLKEYASSFLKIIENFSPENPKDIKSEMLKLIREAINKDKLNSKISGIFEGGSKLLNYVGLIPAVGTIAGAVGIASDLAAKGIDKVNDKNRWYELASQIQRTRSMEKIHRALKNIPST